MRVIAIVNQKGGCGKTTTTVNLAGCLSADGARVLVVDLDPQAHSTLALGIDPETVDENLFEVLTDPDGAARLERVIAGGHAAARAGAVGHRALGARAAARERAPGDAHRAARRRARSAAGPLRLRADRLPAQRGPAHLQRAARRRRGDRPARDEPLRDPRRAEAARDDRPARRARRPRAQRARAADALRRPDALRARHARADPRAVQGPLLRHRDPAQREAARGGRTRHCRSAVYAPHRRTAASTMPRSPSRSPPRRPPSAPRRSRRRRPSRRARWSCAIGTRPRATCASPATSTAGCPTRACAR